MKITLTMYTRIFYGVILTAALPALFLDVDYINSHPWMVKIIGGAALLFVPMLVSMPFIDFKGDDE